MNIMISAKISRNESHFDAKADHKKKKELTTGLCIPWLKVTAVHIIKCQIYYQRSMAIEGIYLFMRVINILSGIGLIAMAIFTIINIFNVLTFKIFLIPSPIFVGFFGVLLIASELKIKKVIKALPFLGSLLGRGIFNIYLSSVAFWFLQNQEVAAWIAAILLFVSGIVYMVFHCGWAKQLHSQYEKEEKDYKKGEDDKDTPVRQNLI